MLRPDRQSSLIGGQGMRNDQGWSTTYTGLMLRRERRRRRRRRRSGLSSYTGGSTKA
jgi:hypothetical protein